MIILNSRPPNINWKNWERFIVPLLADRKRETIIFYYLHEGQIFFRTKIGDYDINSNIPIEELLTVYKNREIEVGIEAPPETSDSVLINKFNQDFLDGRGVPEERPEIIFK